jgi:UDP-N-acetylglucosamine diphosphorylase / glucose-1-phosphate thymidylyltransferase / UDP-N-acetylgalactosamine diphosphorylase / glucosamine-1-phosphate N-acetyltransferase / galactosamine-1-phosphate N-acetyltransferase
MKVVFLCGGIGKRMFPITEDKFLLDFMGRTLLEHQMAMARDAGLTDFVIIGNSGNIERIKQLAASVKGTKFEFALQTQPLGIADALKRAAPFLNSEILVVNPNDVFSGSAYTALLEGYKSRAASSYMLGYRVKHYFPGGYLAVNDQGELTRIVEKPEPGTEPSDLVNILLHLHTNVQRLFEYIDIVQTTRDDVYECAMDGMARHAHKIKVINYEDCWAPIKYPWHIFDIVKIFLDAAESRISDSVSISERAVITGKVVIGENVRILENAVIRGPVYIGPGCVIGNNALIREYSHISAGCVVGFSTEIKGSYVGDNCWFHSSYIGDSIIGDNCSFGAGTVTANFRFDEANVPVKYNQMTVDTGRTHFGAIIGDNCKTGINSGILPGRRLGPNSIVGSHVCLTEDLAPDTMVAGQQQCQFTKHDISLGKVKNPNASRELGK